MMTASGSAAMMLVTASVSLRNSAPVNGAINGTPAS